MADENGVDIARAESDETGAGYAELTQAVRELVQVMRQGDLERLEVSRGDLRILLCAQTAGNGASPAYAPAPNVAQDGVPSDAADTGAESVNYHYITSPMVGTFYEAPAPGEPPYVRPGDTVETGQTVAIIEAMKIMNEIVADRPGVIDAVLAENGETVEYGHPIFRLRPA